jgi:hypothetical protein
MSALGGGSSLTLGVSSQNSKAPLYIGVGLVVVILIIALVMNMSKGDTEKEVETEEEKDSPSPSPPPPTVNADSCQSYVDAKVCPASSVTPATSEACSSFVTAEATRVTGIHNVSWCKSQYATLRTISPACIKMNKYIAAFKQSISNIFSAPNTYYLKRVTTTSSSISSELFMKKQATGTIVVNTAALSAAMAIAANKYVIPEVGERLNVPATVQTKFPLFNTDKGLVDAHLLATTQGSEVTRQSISEQIAMLLVNAMRAEKNWTKTYETPASGTSPKLEYYRLNAVEVANDVEKAFKAGPTYEYTSLCGAD